MPAAVPSLVHSVETSIPFHSNYTYVEYLRHFCTERYDAAEAVYSYLDDLNGTSKRWTLEYCRSHAWFTRNSDTGEVRVASNSCHLRWCPVCADSRRNYISHSVSEWVSEQSHPKFLTLTLKHSKAGLSFQVDCLYNCFRSLRRRNEFRKAVPGGIWFFQVKRSKTDGKWHPHLHCLISGDYIPHARLSRIWLQITYTSSVVDIRPIKDPQKAANDAARYAAAPGSLVGLPLSKAVELVEAMHGRRICGTWGTARSVSLRPSRLQDSGKWQALGSWGLVTSNRLTDPNAKSIFLAWQLNEKLPEGVSCYHLDPDALKISPKEIEHCYLDFMYPEGRSPPWPE